MLQIGEAQPKQELIVVVVGCHMMDVVGVSLPLFLGVIKRGLRPTNEAQSHKKGDGRVRIMTAAATRK